MFMDSITDDAKIFKVHDMYIDSAAVDGYIFALQKYTSFVLR
jgi:hypothetical protein